MTTYSAYGKKGAATKFKLLLGEVSRGEAMSEAQDYYDTWATEETAQVSAGGLAGLFGETKRIVTKPAVHVAVLVVNDDTGRSVWGCSN